ncbi:hypothetical protein CHS0354_036720 [Potamilus streckersoni]|uniref:F-box domain-containing protein n=1 Tax=Potamilus streckersoni TaxID=2493646 RepID=A0AAE0TCI7_9BIVA|nr:hypothetical protein CHS0354_036720 [Potamilus streckersoni]
MNNLHNRSPSDPGPLSLQLNNKDGSSKTNFQRKQEVDEADMHFISWLHTMGVQFMQLTDRQKIQTLDHMVTLCSPKELIHFSDILPVMLYRDFLRLLPVEISARILIHLDEKSLLNCRLVSRQWNNLINSLREVWMHMAIRVGTKVQMDLRIPAHIYKKRFIKTVQLINKVKTRSAFDVMTLEGHRGRVMAIYYGENKVATGSDDHTVRLWDISTGECLKVIHTHSVSALQFDDEYVYTASYDNTAACWHFATGHLVTRYGGHTSAVFSLDARKDIDIIVTGSADKTVKIWQLSSGILLKTLADWHNDWVTRIKILSYMFSETGHQTFHLVSADRRGCCFWTVCDDKVDVSTTHNADWCMSVPYVTKNETVSLCTYMQHDKVQSISTYNTETISKRCIPHHKSTITIPKDVPAQQSVLGLGQKFAIFMVDEGYSRAMIVDVQSSRVMCSIPVPPYRPTQNGASATLGSADWLDGFSEENTQGLFLALCQKDNSILLLKWKGAQE